MIPCPDCGGQLRVLHTYRASGNVWTRDMRCADCRKARVWVGRLLDEERRGARALATYIRKNGMKALDSPNGEVETPLLRSRQAVRGTLPASDLDYGGD